MARHKDFVPVGVIPAVVLPFKPDLEIDEHAFRGHLRDVSATPGLSAITINAHSTEAASCTLDEQKRVLDIAQDEIGARMPIVHGVYAEGSLEGARIARQAAVGGASALLVFPPGPFTMGHRPEMVIEHFKRVADAAADIPKQWRHQAPMPTPCPVTDSVTDCHLLSPGPASVGSAHAADFPPGPRRAFAARKRLRRASIDMAAPHGPIIR